MPWVRDGDGLRLVGDLHFIQSDVQDLIDQLRRRPRNQPAKVCRLLDDLIANRRASRESIWFLSKWCHWNDPSHEIARSIAGELFHGVVCRRLLDKKNRPDPDLTTAEADYETWLERVVEEGRSLQQFIPGQIDESISDSNSSAGEDWSNREGELIVGDYFDMLRLDLLRQPYAKTEHRRQLIPQLRGRSEGSVEFKHQNISAVLIRLGYPYIRGYEPRGNFQAKLVDQVESFLSSHPRFFDELAQSAALNPSELPNIGQVPAHAIFEPPPEMIEAPNDVPEPWKLRRGRNTDFARRDAENRSLGRQGEEYILQCEKSRLTEKGRDDLARKIEWVSDTQGDGMGFDIISFDEQSNAERWIEVKTTDQGKFFPFYVSSNELRCSEACSDRYRLFRVFEFYSSRRVYVLEGALSATCKLEPVQFRATI